MNISVSHEEPHTEEIMANYEDPPSPEYPSSTVMCQVNDENLNYQGIHNAKGSPNGAQDSSGDMNDFLSKHHEDAALKKDIKIPSVCGPKAGFTTAKGTPMIVSASSKAKILDLFKEEMMMDLSKPPESLSSNGVILSRSNENKVEFSTAGGKDVTISDTAQTRAKALFVEDEELFSSKPVEKCATSEKMSKPIFLTGNGTKVAVSKDALNQAKTIWKSKECAFDENKVGFSTAGGKEVSVTNTAQERAKALFAEDEDYFPPKAEGKCATGKKLNMPMFLSGNGTKVNISKEALDKVKAVSRSKECDSNGVSEIKVGFATAGGKEVAVTNSSHKRAKALFAEDEEFTSSKSEENNVKNDKSNVPIFLTGKGTKVNITDDAKKQVSGLFRTKCTISEEAFDKPKVVHEKSSSQSVEKENLSCSSQDSVKKRKLDFDDENVVKKMCFDDAFEEDLDTQMLQDMEDASVTKSVPPVAATVIELRKAKRIAQDVLLKDKNTVQRQEGKLSLKKRQTKCRLKLKDFDILKSDDGGNSHDILDRSILEITSELAADHVFLGRQYFSEETLATQSSLFLGDGAEVIFDDYSNFDRDAIVAAFMTSPGVSRSKVSLDWVRNHYRWIVWKLASYERRFPDKFKGVFHPEQVLWQLKYRYDMEIEGETRTCLRKIYEKDDIAGKAMVLCVANIVQLDQEKVFLELTDGWYSIGCVCQDEEAFQKAVKNYQIQCGIKLVTFGAELVNHNQACAPLEAPQLIDQDIIKKVLRGIQNIPLLKLSFNSTRRAKWDAKLGYLARSTMPTSIDKLVSNGGLASELTLYVARKYPIGNIYFF